MQTNHFFKNVGANLFATNNVFDLRIANKFAPTKSSNQNFMTPVRDGQVIGLAHGR